MISLILLLCGSALLANGLKQSHRGMQMMRPHHRSSGYAAAMLNRGFGPYDFSSGGGYGSGNGNLEIVVVSLPRVSLDVVQKNCSDFHDLCEAWALSSECETNPHFMLRYCKQSCGICAALNTIPKPCGFFSLESEEDSDDIEELIEAFASDAQDINSPGSGPKGPGFYVKKARKNGYGSSSKKHGATSSYGQASSHHKKSSSGGYGKKMQRTSYGSSSNRQSYGQSSGGYRSQQGTGYVKQMAQYGGYKRTKRQEDGELPCISEIEGKALFGGNLGAELEDVSKDECLDACLDDDECKAAVFYKLNGQCLLYDFNSRNMPDRSLMDDVDDAVILEVGRSEEECNGGPCLCANRHSECGYWMSHGQCTLNPLFMLEACRAACLACEP